MTSEEIEFNHLGRLLAGVETRLAVKQDRWGRMARCMFEAHIAQQYDQYGCFCYVGWPTAKDYPPPSQAEQVAVLAAFARAAVATRVYLGALEPNEGFGLAAWKKTNPLTGESERIDPIAVMHNTVAFAIDMLQSSKAVARLPNVAMGCGRLRGSALLGGKPEHVILDGPRVVGSLYGEIPNRCGAIAKGKDEEAQKAKPDAHLTVFSQAWTRFHYHDGRPLAGGTPNGLNTVFVPPIIPDSLIEHPPIADPKPEPFHRRPFVIAFSLDFAQSRMEFSADAHLARTTVNKLLTAFEALTGEMKGLFVSPRYGDGVAAVLVTEAVSEAAVLDPQQKWFNTIRSFCAQANEGLVRCEHLGLRIGMAIEEDLGACAARLAGVSQTTSPAVEEIAQTVVTKARLCHHIAKYHQKVVAHREAKWLWVQPGERTVKIIG